MPTLIALDGPNRGSVLSLEPGKNVIGRDGAVPIRLPDPSVSRRHAVITLEDGGACTLSDLGSTNATYLNGIRITHSRKLEHGDEVTVGNTILLYLDEVPEKKGAAASALAETSKIDAKGSSAVAAAASGASTARAGYLIGESDAMRIVSDFIVRCAPLDTTVLIVGESGTGKELVANALHRLSPRRQAPFVVVNCATLEPPLLESELFGHERGAFTGAIARKLGKLEIAQGGTLFLDEVGELPLEAQAKLLRAMDARQFTPLGGNQTLTTTARFVAATHRDLQTLVRQGRFREDLLFRLRVVEIDIPPLRDRTQDIPPLVTHILTELRQKIAAPAKQLTAAALDRLCQYAFPGNVRELRNIIERCLIFCERAQIDLDDLPPEVREGRPRVVPQALPARYIFPGSPGQPGLPDGDLTPVTHIIGTRSPVGGGAGGSVESLSDLERVQVLKALEATGWNKSQAAKILAIHRNTLNAMIKRYGLRKPGETGADAPEPEGDEDDTTPPR